MKFKSNIKEKIVLDKYLKKLNFNKKGTFNFENDAGFLNSKKNYKIIITTDSISENIDFFKNDNPKSIANKIITYNLSDLSAMGANPSAYTLNLFLPKYIDSIWMNIFTKELLKLQKKYNFYLLGGDLSRSNNLTISATFFGYQKINKIITQNKISLNSDIWITGNLGDSYLGLQILKNKIQINDIKLKKYFVNKYYFPNPCLIGSKISYFTQSAKDISDGLLGDLKKMLNNRYGAFINLNKIPISSKLLILIKKGIIKKNQIINCGDNYELIIISSNKNRNKINKFAKQNNIKITRIGKIMKNLGFQFDSNNLPVILREFDHFL